MFKLAKMIKQAAGNAKSLAGIFDIGIAHVKPPEVRPMLTVIPANRWKTGGTFDDYILGKHIGTRASTGTQTVLGPGAMPPPGVSSKAINEARPNAATGNSLVGKILTIAGLGGALGGGTYLASRGMHAAKQNVTRQPRFKAMMDDNPDLKLYPKKDVGKMFEIVHEYGPDLTKSPTVAGSFVRKALEYKDLGVSPASIKELAEISGTIQKTRGTRAALISLDSAKMPTD